MTKTFGNSVDAKAPANGTRPGVFVPRPAPSRVNYLDYPGTMGVDDIDYVVARRVVAKPKQRPYAEKIVHPSDMAEHAA